MTQTTSGNAKVAAVACENFEICGRAGQVADPDSERGPRTTAIEDLVVLQAAVLHDTIEDTKTTYQELLDRFGEAVTRVVAEVTDDKSLPKAQRKELQVEHAPHMSREGALVKLADKTCNLWDMANAPPAGWPLERRREYFDWAKRVVDGLPAVSAELERAFDAAYELRP